MQELAKIIFSQTVEDIAPLLWASQCCLWQVSILIGDLMFDSICFPIYQGFIFSLSLVFRHESFLIICAELGSLTRNSGPGNFVDVFLWRGHNFCFHFLPFWSSFYLEVDPSISIFYFFWFLLFEISGL